MIRVLLVDDSKAVHAYVRSLLNEKEFDLVDVFNGEEAMGALKKGLTVDVVLLDWEMPVLDGPSTLEQMVHSNIRVPVIMLTSKNDPKFIEQMLNAGANEYVMKPFTPDILLEKLKDVAQKK